MKSKLCCEINDRHKYKTNERRHECIYLMPTRIINSNKYLIYIDINIVVCRY